MESQNLIELRRKRFGGGKVHMVWYLSTGYHSVDGTQLRTGLFMANYFMPILIGAERRRCCCDERELNQLTPKANGFFRNDWWRASSKYRYWRCNIFTGFVLLLETKASLYKDDHGP